MKYVFDVLDHEQALSVLLKGLGNPWCCKLRIQERVFVPLALQRLEDRVRLADSAPSVTEGASTETVRHELRQNTYVLIFFIKTC